MRATGLIGFMLLEQVSRPYKSIEREVKALERHTFTFYRCYSRWTYQKGKVRVVVIEFLVPDVRSEP